jgi:hypothetical protein
MDLALPISIIVIWCLSVWLNIRLARQRVGKWDSNSTIWFVASLAQIWPRTSARSWNKHANYAESDAKTIRKFQNLCLIEMYGGFFAMCFLHDKLSHGY